MANLKIRDGASYTLLAGTDQFELDNGTGTYYKTLLSTISAFILKDSALTGTTTAAAIRDSGLTASTVVSCDTNKQLQSLLIGSSLSLTANSLNAIQDIGVTSSPIFTGLNLSGLTVNSLVVTDSSKNLVSIAGGTSNKLLGRDNAGTAFEYKGLAGTTNQVILTDGIGTITFSLPQDVNTTSTPTFANLIDNGLTDSTIVSCNASKQLQSLDIGSSLLLAGNNLNTIQDIRNTANTVFSSVTADIRTDHLSEKTLGHGVVVESNVFLSYNSSPSFTPGSNQIPTVKYVDDHITPTDRNNLLTAGDFRANPWKRGTSFTSSTPINNHTNKYHADMWMTLCENDIPENMNFFNSFSTQLNADFAIGAASAVPFGGADISNGVLDLAHSDTRYVWYAPFGNSPCSYYGKMIYTIIPNYSVAPHSAQSFPLVTKSLGDIKNLVGIEHNTAGHLSLSIGDKDGYAITTTDLGAWSPIAGQEYTFELYWNVFHGLTYLKINGVQLGATVTATGERDSNVGVLLIGTDPQGVSVSNYKLKNIYIHNEGFYASFSNDIDAGSFIGSRLGTSVGGAAVLNSKLDLTHSDMRYVTYDAVSNADSTQSLKMMYTYIPNYSGAPTVTQGLPFISKSLGDNRNLISLYHLHSSGLISMVLRNSSGAILVTRYFGTWLPIINTEYVFELYINLTNGQNILRINGVQLGAVDRTKGTRDSSIGIIGIGTDVTDGLTSNYSIKNFSITKNNLINNDIIEISRKTNASGQQLSLKHKIITPGRRFGIVQMVRSDITNDQLNQTAISAGARVCGNGITSVNMGILYCSHGVGPGLDDVAPPFEETAWAPSLTPMSDWTFVANQSYNISPSGFTDIKLENVDISSFVTAGNWALFIVWNDIDQLLVGSELEYSCAQLNWGMSAGDFINENSDEVALLCKRYYDNSYLFGVIPDSVGSNHKGALESIKPAVGASATDIVMLKPFYQVWGVKTLNTYAQTQNYPIVHLYSPEVSTSGIDNILGNTLGPSTLLPVTYSDISDNTFVAKVVTPTAGYRIESAHFSVENNLAI